jgi:hypothetical protein
MRPLPVTAREDIYTGTVGEASDGGTEISLEGMGPQGLEVLFTTKQG